MFRARDIISAVIVSDVRIACYVRLVFLKESDVCVVYRTGSSLRFVVNKLLKILQGLPSCLKRLSAS
jgi:hypothetical protein